MTRPQSFRFRSGEFVMIGLPGEARQAAAARLFDRQALLRRGDRVPLDQGPRRAADLEAAADPARRPDPDGPQDHRHPGARRAEGRPHGCSWSPPARASRPSSAWRAIPRPTSASTRWSSSTPCARSPSWPTASFGARDPVRPAGRRGGAASSWSTTPCVTREPFERQGRITDRIRSGDLFRDLDMPGVRLRPGARPGHAVRLAWP